MNSVSFGFVGSPRRTTAMQRSDDYADLSPKVRVDGATLHVECTNSASFSTRKNWDDDIFGDDDLGDKRSQQYTFSNEMRSGSDTRGRS